MTTADTDALNRRIAEALDPYSEIIAVHEGYGAEVVVHGHQSAVIAAVLPIVAAEVRKAKAEALREAADFWQDTADHNTPADIEPDWLRARAAEYETGDSDEHR